MPLGLAGGTGWQAGYPPGPRPLYLQKEIEAAPADLVTIHGGEKAVDVFYVTDLTGKKITSSSREARIREGLTKVLEAQNGAQP